MRKERKYNYIYKTTCNVTNKYYVGMHSTDNLEDGYMGSGKRLWFSINYHGKDNHSVEILEWYDTRLELKTREKELVNEDLLKEDLCMNLMVGGEGGGGLFNEEHKKAFTDAGINNFKNSKEKRETTLREKVKDVEWLTNRNNNIGNSIKKHLETNPNGFEGKTHSEETKEKMRKPKNIGKANSQYGTCWITKDGENKKIKKEDFNEYLEMGWIRGRK